MLFDDEHWLRQAYQEALRALDEGEVPIGAVIVKEGRIIGRGYNRIEGTNDASAHAEILAIGAASNYLEDWRLNDCTLYVTLEPCIMCMGAILQSRIARVVFGATDNNMGAVETSDYREQLTKVYARFPETTGGVLKEECTEVIRAFFRDVRTKAKTKKSESPEKKEEE